jgi:CRP-like cAMP-binding protein
MCNIVAILADNNSKLIEKTDILCKKTLRGKILAYLEHEANEAHSKKFVVPFSRTDLANYLDADRSALTRELARMRDEGIVNFEKNTFELLE